MQVFVEMWVTHYGMPGIVVENKRSEFVSTFSHECDEFWIDIRVVGSHAGWNDGGLLSEIWNKIVCEIHDSGREQAKLAPAMCVEAMNTTLMRRGFTAEQAVFAQMAATGVLLERDLQQKLRNEST